MTSDASKTQPNSKRCSGKLLLLSLLLAALILIANKSYLNNKSYNRLLIQGHLDYARAQGYPTTMAELYAFYEYPPPGENAADLYLEAFEYFVEWDEENQKLIPFIGEDDFPPPGEYMDEPTLEIVSQYLDDNHDALILLHRAALFPQCRYPIESDNKWYSIAHYSDIRHGIRILALESLYYANRHRFDLAVQVLLDSFSLANSLNNEPLLISMIVQAACVEVNISVLNDILTMTVIPKKFLAELKNTLILTDYDCELKRAMIGEYAFIFEYASLLYDCERENLLHINNLRGCIKILKKPISDRVRYAKTKVRPNWFFEKYEKEYEMAIQCLWASFATFAKYETTKRLAITALAIEQYRHDHKKLPRSLNNLVPVYLKSVLKDPYDGNDLRYKKLEKGYVAYSVGEDLTDNDGAIKNADGYTNLPGTDITFTVRR